MSHMLDHCFLGDKRPKRFGWAPGSYECQCYRCNERFIGDKRAFYCADCAYAMPDLPEETPSVPYMWGDLSAPVPVPMEEAFAEIAKAQALLNYDRLLQAVHQLRKEFWSGPDLDHQKVAAAALHVIITANGLKELA